MLYVSRVLKKHSYIKAVAVATAMLMLTACGGQPSEDAASSPSAQIQLSPSNPSVVLGGSLAFSAGNGTAPYVYGIVSGSGTIDSASGLFNAPGAAGSVVVGVVDQAGKTATTTVAVVGPVNIVPSVTNVLAGGTRSFSGSGGKTPYSYSVVSGAGSVNATSGVYSVPGGTGAGSATIRITDSLGQTANASVTIYPELTISPSSISLAVNDTQAFSAAGGMGGYTYSVVSGGGSIDSASGLFTAPATPSTVTIQVADSGANTATATVYVVGPLSISPTTWEMAANNSKAFVGVGGQVPYIYSVLSGGGSINSATGTYTAPGSADSVVVRVTDAFGQTADAAVTVRDPLQINPATLSLNINDTHTFTATGGVGTYAYSIVSGGASINSSSGFFTAGGSPSTVTVRVTDSLGNQSDATVTVQSVLSISPTSYTLAVNNVYTFSASGGQMPYTYSILSGGGSINSSTGQYTAPASSGAAVVRVTDNLGATADANVTINPALTIAPTAVNMLTNGAQTFTGSGGVTPYVYSIVSGGGSINSSSGAYTAPTTPTSAVIRVTDARGNTADASANVVQPLVITPSTYTLAVNNTHTFVATGGEAPYVFSMQSGGGSVNPATGLYTAPAVAGSAVVRVTDNLGSTADATITINPALAISPATITVALNGSQAFTASGGVSPYVYSVLSGGGSIGSSSGVYSAPGTPGSATVRVTDALGNTSDSAVTISSTLQISPTTWTMAVNNLKTFGGVNGQPPYTFSKVSGGGSIDPSTGVYTAPATAGSAVVRVTDSLAQTADATITINPALAISPATITKAVNSNHTFAATGGVTPYTYSIFSGGGSIGSSSGSFTAPATAQSVTVRVTDNVGNTSDSAVTVVDALVIDPLTLNILIDDSQIFTATGGVPGYTYTIFSGGGVIDSGTGDFTAPSAAGTTVVRVTDSIGLTSDATVQVYEPLTIDPTTLTLAPDNTHQFTTTGGLGTITFSVVSGTGTIDANTGDYTAPGAAGTDVVRATDSIGNTADATITINGALLISPATKKISINETFTFTATNGVPPRTFSIEAGGGTIDPSTGLYTAPSTSQAVTVRVTDSLDNISEATVTIITPVKVWSGGYNSCVKYDDNSLKCWGDGANGKLGAGSTTDRGDGAGEMGSNLAFVDLGAGRYPKEMALGQNHMCAILDNDSLKCWGTNTNGQLGLGDNAHRGDGAGEMGDSLPTVNVGTGRTVKFVTVGPNNTCAILDNDDLKCWGLGTYGINGQGNATTIGTTGASMGDNLNPVNLGTGRYAVEVGIGTSHMCARLDNSSIKCWGRSNRGQLGQGNTLTLGDAPAEMGNGLPTVNFGTGRTAKKLSVGNEFNCVITDEDLVKCWGRSNTAQLGQGGTLTKGDGGGEMGDSLPYTSLGSGLTVIALKSEAQKSCVIMSNGAFKCWGYGLYGDLGKGSTANLGDSAAEMGDNLTNIDTNSTIDQYSVGLNHSCVMSPTKELKCWGRATQGALGNGTTTTHIGDGAGEMGVNLPRVNL